MGHNIMGLESQILVIGGGTGVTGSTMNAVVKRLTGVCGSLEALVWGGGVWGRVRRGVPAQLD